MTASFKRRDERETMVGWRAVMDRLPILASAVGGSLVVAAAGIALTTGPSSRHMLLHIVFMNVLAPLAALAVPSGTSIRLFFVRTIWVATILQMSLLYLWHAPSILFAMHQSHAAGIMVMAAITLAAFWFWSSVAVVLAEARYWCASAALLISGKLFCVLGVILMFLPGARDTAGFLSDGQLAGLLMVLACSATYLLGAVISAHLALAAPNPAVPRKRSDQIHIKPRAAA